MHSPWWDLPATPILLTSVPQSCQQPTSTTHCPPRYAVPPRSHFSATLGLPQDIPERPEPRSRKSWSWSLRCIRSQHSLQRPRAMVMGPDRTKQQVAQVKGQWPRHSLALRRFDMQVHGGDEHVALPACQRSQSSMWFPSMCGQGSEPQQAIRRVTPVVADAACQWW